MSRSLKKGPYTFPRLLKRVKDYLGYWGDKNGIDVNKMLKYNSKYELHFAQQNSTYVIGTAENFNLHLIH